MTSELERVGRQLRSARNRQEVVMTRARAAALDALEQEVSEVEIAKTLGVDRMTVRKWAGKR